MCWYVLVYLIRTTLNHNGCMPYHIIMFAIQKNSRIFHNAPMKFSHVNYDYKVLKKPVIIFLKKSFREYYVFVSNAAAAASQFLVSVITFEGFKLHSSNLTHALLIQISRMSSIIDIVIPFKMARRWPVKFNRKWISDTQNGRSIWNDQNCNQKWFSDIQNGWRRPF